MNEQEARRFLNEQRYQVELPFPVSAVFTHYFRTPTKNYALRSLQLVAAAQSIIRYSAIAAACDYATSPDPDDAILKWLRQEWLGGKKPSFGTWYGALMRLTAESGKSWKHPFVPEFQSINRDILEKKIQPLIQGRNLEIGHAEYYEALALKHFVELQEENLFSVMEQFSFLSPYLLAFVEVEDDYMPPLPGTRQSVNICRGASHTFSRQTVVPSSPLPPGIPFIWNTKYTEIMTLSPFLIYGRATTNTGQKQDVRGVAHIQGLMVLNGVPKGSPVYASLDAEAHFSLFAFEFPPKDRIKEQLESAFMRERDCPLRKKSRLASEEKDLFLQFSGEVSIPGASGNQKKSMQKMKPFLRKPHVLSQDMLHPDSGRDITSMLKSERKLVTVMFVGISSPAELPEAMDPEQVRDLLNDYFEQLLPIVIKYEGVINRFFGDSIMVLFGIPNAIEHAPAKAVRSAIEMRNAISQLNREKNPKVHIDIHIGIHTGTVVACSEGSGENIEYTVFGDAVNLASSLKDLSGKGNIHVGPLTYKYTRNEFGYAKSEQVFLKDKNESVAAYKLVSAGEGKSQTGYFSGREIYSEMVGRDKELDRLEYLILKALNGEGSIVSVVGEAGIGKSRLISELKKREIMNKVMFFEGRALSSGENLIYHPIIDVIKNWADIKEDDTETDSANKIKKAIRIFYPDGVSEIFPFIAIIMGKKLNEKDAERVKGIEGEALEKLIFLSLRKLLIKGAEIKPLVIIIEDIHWADITSIELLASLFKLVENNRILFINVFRPNYTNTGERLLKIIEEKYSEYHITMHLEPLNNDQCHILLNNLLKIKEFPAHIRERIAERADGNPYFIEEVVRSFIDDRIVKIVDGNFKATENIDSAEIPLTIQDLLISRIDKLDETTKTLMKCASVIGRYFLYRILARVTQSIDEIDEKIDYLREIQLICERIGIIERELYFKHALLQEATYESILIKRRKELHLEIANAIESLFSERLSEFYGMLAYHYGKAENLDKAQEYLIKAGEEALKSSASSEALNLFQEALKLYLKKHGDLNDNETMANIEKNIALALHNKGFFVKAVDYFDKALDYRGIRRSKNQFVAAMKDLFELINIIMYLYLPKRKSKKDPSMRDKEIIYLSQKRAHALVHVDTKRMFLETIGTVNILNKLDLEKVENGLLTYIECSTLFSLSGVSFRISKKILDYTKNYVKSSDLRSVSCYKLCVLVYNYLSGNWKNEKYDEKTVELFLKAGDVFQASAYTSISAQIQIEQGNFKHAKMLIDKLVEIGEQYNREYNMGEKYLINAKLLLKHRKLTEAFNETENGIFFLNKIHQNLPAFTGYGIKANIQYLLKDIDGMRKSMFHAKEYSFNAKEISMYWNSNYYLSHALYHIFMLEESSRKPGRPNYRILRKTAYDSVMSAVKNSMKYAANKTEAFKLMGNYYWIIENQKKGLYWYDKSIKAGKHLGAFPELARTYLEVGERMLERKSKYKELSGISAKEYIETAKTLFQQMNLEWDI